MSEHPFAHGGDGDAREAVDFRPGVALKPESHGAFSNRLGVAVLIVGEIHLEGALQKGAPPVPKGIGGHVKNSGCPDVADPVAEEFKCLSTLFVRRKSSRTDPIIRNVGSNRRYGLCDC